MNTIVFSPSNNINIITNDNSIQTNSINVNGINCSNALCTKDKNANNIKDYSSFNSRNKNTKKYKDKKFINNNLKKEINTFKNKNNSNNIKAASLFKNKTTKSSINNIYSNFTYTNKSKKKNYKSSKNKNNSININKDIKQNESNENKDINEYNYIDLNNKKSFEIKSDNTNSFNNLNNKDLLYETIRAVRSVEKKINNLNENLIVTNNTKRSQDLKNEEINNLNSLNTIKSYNYFDNDSNNEENNIDNIKDRGYQTYNGPFRKNVIKVNVLDRDSKHNKNNENIKNSIVENNSNKKSIIFMNKENHSKKSSSNLKTSIDKSLIKNDKKEIYLDTEYKNSKNKKQVYDTTDDYEIDKLKEEIIKNNEKQKELSTILNNKNNIIYFNNNLKSNKGINSNSVINTLNFNIFPLSRDECKINLKKQSSDIDSNIFNANIYSGNTSNRGLTIKHKKNNSLSSSCYNPNRDNKEYKMNYKDKKYNNYIYSPKKKKIGKNLNSKSVVIPEYRIKLDSIKSRVTELFNVYSLLAIRSINISNENNDMRNKIKDKNIDIY